MALPLRKIAEKKIRGDEHLNHNANLIDKRLEGSNDIKTVDGYNTETPPAGMGPKEEGGKEFVRMHTIQKVADRNGNGDEVFNGSNVKTYKGERHGYKTGEDAKAYDNGRSLAKEEVEHLEEKAVSTAQQQLAAIALMYKRGKIKKASKAAVKMANSMTEKQLRDFAKTEHKGLPKKVSEAVSTSIQNPTGVSAPNAVKKRKVPPTEGAV